VHIGAELELMLAQVPGDCVGELVLLVIWNFGRNAGEPMNVLKPVNVVSGTPPSTAGFLGIPGTMSPVWLRPKDPERRRNCRGEADAEFAYQAWRHEAGPPDGRAIIGQLLAAHAEVEVPSARPPK